MGLLESQRRGADLRHAARVGCHKARSGLGDGHMCVTHGRPWPCEVGRQVGEQLALLTAQSPASEAVLARVMAERRYALGGHPPEADDRRDAFSWVGLLVDYLNKANVEGRRLAEAELVGARVDLRVWRDRLEQIAGVAIAAAESVDRVLPDGVTDPDRRDWAEPDEEATT